MARDKDNVSSIVLGISIRVFINIFILFILIEGVTMAYGFSYKVFADISYQAGSTEMQSITVAPDSSVKEIASVLEQNGIVENQYLFLVRIYLGKYDTRIQAGTYSLGPGMTPDEICKKICGIQSEEMS